MTHAVSIAGWKTELATWVEETTVQKQKLLGELSKNEASPHGAMEYYILLEAKSSVASDVLSFLEAFKEDELDALQKLVEVVVPLMAEVDELEVYAGPIFGAKLDYRRRAWKEIILPSATRLYFTIHKANRANHETV